MKELDQVFFLQGFYFHYFISFFTSGILIGYVQTGSVLPWLFVSSADLTKLCRVGLGHFRCVL